jgi:hypothetical protein
MAELTNILLPQGHVFDHYQLLASCDLLTSVNETLNEWKLKKFLTDVQYIYKKVQYQIFNVYKDGIECDKIQFRSGFEIFEYVTKKLNEALPFSCNMYYDFNKKNIILMNNGIQYLFIPSIIENAKFKRLENVVESIIKRMIKEDNAKVKYTKQDILDFFKDESDISLKSDFARLKAMLWIYHFQTETEKETDSTHIYNDVGFSGPHAQIMSAFSKQLYGSSYLSEKQLVIVRKIIKRYAGQIVKLLTSGKIANGQNPKIEDAMKKWYQKNAKNYPTVTKTETEEKKKDNSNLIPQLTNSFQRWDFYIEYIDSLPQLLAAERKQYDIAKDYLSIDDENQRKQLYTIYNTKAPSSYKTSFDSFEKYMTNLAKKAK